MKKIFVVFLTVLIFPLNVFAYSDRVILGGETLGVQIENNGIIVEGFYKVKGKYINDYLKNGDIIVKINGEEISSINSLLDIIESNMKDNKVKITYKRDNREYEDYLELVKDGNHYKTGIYVKGIINGIGTLTYVDPSSNVYGMLGHVIIDSKSNKKVEVKSGYSYFTKNNEFTRSKNGNPGSKNAIIDYDKKFGNIINNSNYGVFGLTDDLLLSSDSIEVAKIDEVVEGKAYIVTSNDKNIKEKYEINILKIDKESNEKNYLFEIVDSRLLEMSGGIVQGMSGSPIIQNDKIVGAVTRVLVEDVKKGYGINIETMLLEGDKLVLN